MVQKKKEEEKAIESEFEGNLAPIEKESNGTQKIGVEEESPSFLAFYTISNGWKKSKGFRGVLDKKVLLKSLVITDNNKIEKYKSICINNQVPTEDQMRELGLV